MTAQIRATLRRRAEEQALAEFVEQLLEALSIPEVAAAVAAVLPARPSPRPTAPARGQPTGRGRGRR